MFVTVHHIYEDNTRRSFEGGAEDIAAQLLRAYPWLLHRYGRAADVSVLVRALDAQQGYSASFGAGPADAGDIVLVKAQAGQLAARAPGFEAALAAAAFLAGAPAPDAHQGAARAALVATDDVVTAALQAVGLPATPAYKEALEALLQAAGLRKAEGAAPEVQEVTALEPEGQEFAAAVTRAFHGGGQVTPVDLQGRHSAGTLVARDPETSRPYLLKPGSGTSPAAGVSDTGASQAKREAAFYAAAKVMGLETSLPEVHLLLLDGKEYAAEELLGGWQDFNTVKGEDPILPRRVFSLLLGSGLLHRWAVLDYVLGNPDRNAGNVMTRGGEVRLIDHGSALAGRHFAPAEDANSFVPYYLRALTPGDFAALAPEAKLRALPRLSAGAEQNLRTWLEELPAAAIAAQLRAYGVDPTPALERLRFLQGAVGVQAADLAVMAPWVL